MTKPGDGSTLSVLCIHDFDSVVAKGRDEDPEATMSWVRFHDSYGEPADAVATH